MFGFFIVPCLSHIRPDRFSASPGPCSGRREPEFYKIRMRVRLPISGRVAQKPAGNDTCQAVICVAYGPYSIECPIGNETRDMEAWTCNVRVCTAAELQIASFSLSYSLDGRRSARLFALKI